jgi:hypothetical protein
MVSRPRSGSERPSNIGSIQFQVSQSIEGAGVSGIRSPCTKGQYARKSVKNSPVDCSRVTRE